MSWRTSRFFLIFQGFRHGHLIELFIRLVQKGIHSRPRACIEHAHLPGHVQSVLMPICPPKASISRTKWLLPGPPTAGLQGMRAILSRLSVAIPVF